MGLSSRAQVTVPLELTNSRRPSPYGIVEGSLHPADAIKKALAQPNCLFACEKEIFLAANEELLQSWQRQVMPLERIAPEVLQAIYQQQQAEITGDTLLWTVAQCNQCWIGQGAAPLPTLLQGPWRGHASGSVPPHFHCTRPQAGDSLVYGPSLLPADVVQRDYTEIANGCTTGVHEVATF